MFDASTLKIEYPDLPVVEKKAAFLELLKNHSVVIVQADTGSGKSTQLPKFLLESGLALQGRIGVTEPRRLAALTIADRLREELKNESLVATRIRFLEEGSAKAPIKVMTDGILLQEFRRDRLFKQYSAVMIDEAHERSLNIDILLGIFKSVLDARPEFRLIIASATIDAKLFGDFYEGSAVLQAEGRTFPVEVEHRPVEPESSKEKGESGLIEEARDTIINLISRRRDHLLCFLPTERDIQDLASELQKNLDNASFEILPLFGRMSPTDQRKVFRSTSKTRLVLATNIAETSLTIPGIAYVVDSGLARISRYNAQARIQGLPIEEISQASARQRTGRAGRVKPGICVRLYDEVNFNDREPFTEPEIRRSNLANVVLQLQSLGLDIESFPFLQPPPRSAFRGAYKTLHELGALTQAEQGAGVTSFGLEMSRLPMDVALSAVLLRAREFDVLQPALIISAALSIQDPRVLPSEEPERTKARDRHRRFGGHKSDFLVYLSIWNAFSEDWEGSSWNKLRRFCEKHFLHFLRVREWIDLYEQYCRLLKVTFKDRTCFFNTFHRDFLHMALLSGFLGGIARRDIENSCYRLVGGRETHVFPGSDLYGKSVEWLFSAEVRETSRVFLTKNAEIKSEWILKVAEPFCTRQFFEPFWNRERGFVEVREEVSFRGMVITSGRRVDYARINPEDCARVFFREAVVLMNMARPFAFMEHNDRVIQNLHALEARERRFGLAPHEEVQVEFLIAAAPGVNSIRTLKTFIEKNTDVLLRFDASYFVQESKSGVEHFDSFKNKIQWPSKVKIDTNTPDVQNGSCIEMFRIGGESIQGELTFDATRTDDGLSLKIPHFIIPSLSPSFLALQLPRWRDWMIEAMIRELPKMVRKTAKEKHEQIEDLFCTKLEQHPEGAPFKALHEAFLEIKGFEDVRLNLNPDKEHHLRLHLEFFRKGYSEKMALELSPEWGSYRFFSEIRSLVSIFGIDVSVGSFRYGWRLGQCALMSTEESSFWQELLRKIEKGAKQESALLVMDSLTFLEKFGLYKEDIPLPSKDYVFRSLAIEVFDQNELERFSSIEFSRGKKIKDFKQLAQQTRSEDDTLRLILARLTFESGLLGKEAFIQCWNRLKDFSTSIRQNREIPASMKKTLFTFSTIESVFDRLKYITHWLENAPEPALVENPMSLVNVKEIREAFRPFIIARFLKEEERKKAREVLSALEKSANSLNVFFENWLLAQMTLEQFDYLKSKRGSIFASDDEEVEKSSLLKLKGRFGQL
ncbi:MAG TPA: ATP-dependent RNA helicase HrpA [Fibrobacter sp.]|nr:ATP-dependent RNA helicase HrpA [Fibrobacter sp.]